MCNLMTVLYFADLQVSKQVSYVVCNLLHVMSNV